MTFLAGGLYMNFYCQVNTHSSFREAKNKRIKSINGNIKIGVQMMTWGKGNGAPQNTLCNIEQLILKFKDDIFVINKINLKMKTILEQLKLMTLDEKLAVQQTNMELEEQQCTPKRILCIHEVKIQKQKVNLL